MESTQAIEKSGVLEQVPLYFTTNVKRAQWLKLHTNFIVTKKINKLSKIRRADWTYLLCCTNWYGFLLPWSEIEWDLRGIMTEEEYIESITFFASFGLSDAKGQFLTLEEDFTADQPGQFALRIRHWEEWQHSSRSQVADDEQATAQAPKDATAAERQKRFRQNQKRKQQKSGFEQAPADRNALRNGENNDQKIRTLEKEKRTEVTPLPSPPLRASQPIQQQSESADDSWKYEAWTQVLKLVPAWLFKNSTRARTLWDQMCDSTRTPARFGANNHKLRAGIPSYEYFRSDFLRGLKSWLASKETAKPSEFVSFEAWLWGTNTGSSLGYGWVDEWEPAEPIAKKSIRPELREWNPDEEDAPRVNRKLHQTA